MLPVGAAVLVDHRRADTFEEIAMLHRTIGETVFQFQRIADGGAGAAQAVGHLDGTGHRKRRIPRQGLECSDGEITAIRAQGIEDIGQGFTAKMGIDLNLLSSKRSFRAQPGLPLR